MLDLACGDGGFADFLPEQRYRGVDASPEMVAAARRARPRRRRGRPQRRTSRRSRSRRRRSSARSTTRATAARCCARIAGYTEKKLVFDLNPRQYRLDDVRADLRAAGFDRLDLRPFFVPQTQRRRAGRPAAAAAGAERAAGAGSCSARGSPTCVPHRARRRRLEEAVAHLGAELAPVARRRVDLVRDELVGDDDLRAESVGRRAQPAHLRLRAVDRQVDPA